MTAGDRLGDERNAREVSENWWAVVGSASGIQVAVAGVMRCDPGDRNIRAGESERV
jgi:hypothetical protein